MPATNKTIHAISPAVNLLLAATRFSLGTINKTEVELAGRGEINWTIFNNLIRYHRLESLIHDQFGSSMAALFPEATLRILKQRHRTNVAANLLLSAKAIEIFGEFQNNKISLLLTKGLSVENWLYEKPGMRSSGDIDLFIRPGDRTQAFVCMKSMGYQLAYLPDRLVLGSRLSKQFIRAQKDFVFVHSKSNVTVELHWRLAEPHSAFPLSFDEVWNRRSHFNIAGRSIQTLPHDMHAVFLCYHGSKHFWSSLFWLYDIAKLMLKEGTDWPTVVSQAQHVKAEISLGLALVLASRIFLVPIPGIIRQHDHIAQTGEQLSDDIFLKILADVPDWPSSDSMTLASVRQQTSWNSRIHPSRNQFLSGWLRYLFSPAITDWESLKLPDYLTPLYRLWRPLRLLSKSLAKLKA